MQQDLSREQSFIWRLDLSLKVVLLLAGIIRQSSFGFSVIRWTWSCLSRQRSVDWPVSERLMGLEDLKQTLINKITQQLSAKLPGVYHPSDSYGFVIEQKAWKLTGLIDTRPSGPPTYLSR